LAGKKWMLEERITEKHVKTFLDIIILAMLNGEPMYGYNVIALIHKEFGILLSPGSLYPALHSLEQNKLIEATFNKGKIVYHVTPKGKIKFEDAFVAYRACMETMSNFVKTRGNFST